MKLRYFQASILAAMLLVPQIKALDYFKQFQQGVTAASESVTATKETVDALVQLVDAVNISVGAISQKVAQLTKTANGIVTDNPQQSIKNSFGTINNSLDVSMELLPAIKELTEVLSLVGTRILPTISKFPGVPSDVTRDVSTVSVTIATITNEINKIKATLDQWLPKIKNLSTNIGNHAVGIAQQVEGTIADVKKIELF